MSEGYLLSLEKFRLYFLFSSCLCIMHINIYTCSTAFLQRKPRKRNLLADIESASHSASLLFLFNADIFVYIVSQN